MGHLVRSTTAVLTAFSVIQLALVFLARTRFTPTVLPPKAVSLHVLFQTARYASLALLFVYNVQQDIQFMNGQGNVDQASLPIAFQCSISEEMSTSVDIA